MRFKSRTSSALDNPSRWNQPLRPWFDVAGYQQRMDARLGLNRDGKSIVVLRWGQDVYQHLWGEETPRYWLRRRFIKGKFTYWTVPRWIFEIRLEPALYVDAWERTRYSMRDPFEGSPRCDDCGCGEPPVLIKNRIYCARCTGTNISGGAVVDKGPPPAEYFTFMLECARHEAVDPTSGWAACCTRAFYADTKFGGPHSRCWGDYRPPTDDDLELIARAIAATSTTPYDAMTPSQLAETELAANKQVERASEQFEQYEHELMAEVTNRWMAQRAYSGAGGPSHKPISIINAITGQISPHS